MVDRRPQDFPNGTPNGIADNTLAIQAAIDAWQPGDQVVLSGGTFRTSNKLLISANNLTVRGDGAIRALSSFPSNSALLEVTGTGVLFDTDGLTLDQADVLVNGDSVRALVRSACNSSESSQGGRSAPSCVSRPTPPTCFSPAAITSAKATACSRRIRPGLLG